jgi:hypothetical protein
VYGPYVNSVCEYTGVLKAIDASKHPPPEPFNHEEIHAFFKEPEITPVVELQEKGLLVWKTPDFDGERESERERERERERDGERERDRDRE